MNVGELRKLLDSIRDDIQILADGSDCGGYDVERGLNITAELIHHKKKSATDELQTGDYFYIYHNGYEV